MAHDLTVRGQSLPTPASILGGRTMRIPTGGKIRGGIKMLTKTAQQIPAAREIYEAGVRTGQSFDDIERAVLRACPTLVKPLIPRNVAYFTSGHPTSPTLMPPRSCSTCTARTRAMANADSTGFRSSSRQTSGRA